MRLDHGSLRLESWGGALCSVLLFAMISTYFVQKLDILINKREVDLLSVTSFNAHTYEERFDSSMGLNFAAALIKYDGKSEIIDDPTIGELVFNHQKWSRDIDNGR